MDEATQVAVSVSNGDPSAILFVLLPIQHSSTDATVVRQNKRTVEDKLMQLLVFEHESGTVGFIHQVIAVAFAFFFGISG